VAIVSELAEIEAVCMLVCRACLARNGDLKKILVLLPPPNTKACGGNEGPAKGQMIRWRADLPGSPVGTEDTSNSRNGCPHVHIVGNGSPVKSK
jgi:hypothetical protein